MAGLQTGTPKLVVLGRLASGGMGTVSLARTEEGHRVAVKRMHTHLAEDSHFLRMFLDEIWLTGALRHDNVVRLVGWGVDDGGPYFATEFVLGAGLGELLARARGAGESLPHELVAYIGARMAEGLHAAHSLCGPDGESLGIVHRDVTPSNVLIGFDGSIKLTDFGVAKAAQKSTRSRTGMLKGKLSYMAPEYADGRGVDGRSDLYSLGVVLFQLLSGQRPFSGDTDMELLRKIVDRTPPTITSLVPTIHEDLAAIVDRLLAKRPEARGRDAMHVATELDGWLLLQGHPSSTLRARLAAYVGRHCGDRRTRLEALMSRDGADGETLITQRWTAGARPDETMARRAMALASSTEGDSPIEAPTRRDGPQSQRPVTRVAKHTRVAPVAPAPLEAPPLDSLDSLEGEDVTAQTFVPVRRQLLGSRWGMLGIAVAGASVGAVVVALVVAAGRPAPSSLDGPSLDGPPLESPPLDSETPAVVVEEEDADDAAAVQPSASASAKPIATSRPVAVRPAPRPAKTAKTPPPPPAPVPPRPKAPCTPAHFDYPACLKKP